MHLVLTERSVTRSFLRRLFLLAFLLGCGQLPPPPDAGLLVDDAGALVEVDAGLPVSLLPFEVEALRLELDLPTLRAGSTLTLRSPTTEAGCVRVAAPMVDRAQWGDGGTVVFVHDGARLTVCDAPAQTVRSLTSSGVPNAALAPGTDQGFVVRSGEVGRFTSALAWMKGCDRLVACDPAPRLRLPLEFDITHASDEQVLCPGKVTAGPTRTTCMLSEPAPLYSGLTVVAATGWVPRQLAATDAGVVTMADSPSNRLQQGLPADEVAATIEWFTRTLGPLPYGRELTVAVGPMSWLGFEGPGLILLNEAMPDFMLPWPSPIHHAFAHEVAHQWAGNRTTVRESAEFSLKEALAEYLVYRLEAELWPSRAVATRLSWRRAARFGVVYPRPTDLPEPQLLLMAGDGTVTGPMMLLQLEEVLGEDVVFEAVRELLRLPGAIGWTELRDALELRSGRTLGAYFDTWVYGSGEPEWPELGARAVTGADGGWELEVSQRTPSGRLLPLVIDVDVTLASGPRRLTASLGVEQLVPSTRLALDEEPLSWVLDPRQRWLWFPAQTSPLLPESAPPRFIF
jgi:aminopeptidase N